MSGVQKNSKWRWSNRQRYRALCPLWREFVTEKQCLIFVRKNSAKTVFLVCLCNTVNWLQFLGIVAFELRWFVVCLAEGSVFEIGEFVVCFALFILLWNSKVKFLKFITVIAICYFGKLGNDKSSIFRTRDNLPATSDTRLRFKLCHSRCSLRYSWSNRYQK